MSEKDPLEHAESVVRDMHQTMHRDIHGARRKYPLLFLFLVTICIAALFHGLDLLMDQFSFLNEYPITLVCIGVVGLFLTGSLYKRLGKDKFE